MAIIKIHPITWSLDIAINYIKQETKINIEQPLNYIMRDEKTRLEELELITTHACTKAKAHEQFLENQRRWGFPNKKVGARHVIQSFEPGTITPSQAHAIGCELSQKLFSNYAYVVATHVDREHIHNHIIFDNVSFKNGKCYNSSKRSYAQLQKASDEICLAHNQKIITPYDRMKGQSWYAYKSGDGKPEHIKLKTALMISLIEAENWDDFLMRMQKDFGYRIKFGKHIAFRSSTAERYIRSKSLGEKFIEKRMREILLLKKSERMNLFETEIEDQIEASPKRDPSVKGRRRRLMDALKEEIDEAGSWTELIIRMQNRGYSFKETPSPAFKALDGQRFIRLDSLGKNYSADVIEQCLVNARRRKEKEVHLKIRQALHPMLSQFATMRLDRSPGYLRWVHRFNLEAFSKNMKCLDQLGLHSISDALIRLQYLQQQEQRLRSDIKTLEKQLETCFQNLVLFNSYMELIPIQEAFDHQPDETKDKFRQTHAEALAQMDQLTQAFLEQSIDPKTLKTRALTEQIQTLKVHAKKLKLTLQDAQKEQAMLTGLERNFHSFMRTAPTKQQPVR